MKIGVSLPFSYLCRGDEPYGERGNFYRKLRSVGVSSVEMRAVSPDADPKTVWDAAKKLWDAGLQITVHGGVRSSESAVRDIFSPLSLLLQNTEQKSIGITLHPIVGDNRAMLEELTEYIKKNHLPATLTLENNRLMPDKTHGNSTELVENTIKSCDPAIVGITFDMGHYFYQCGFDRDALPSEAFLKRVKHTHIHATCKGETHFPLTFDLPLEKYIRGLGEDYDGIYNLELEPTRWPELNPGEELMGSIERLKESIPYDFKVRQGFRNIFLEDLKDAAKVFNCTQEANRVSLIQSSSYLFKTAGVCWTMDIVLRAAIKIPHVGEALKEALRPAEFTVITHDHEDHFEKETVRYLADLPMKWIIPYFMEDSALAYGLSRDKLVIARPGEAIQIGDFTFLPFEGRHYRPGTQNGIEELGYLVSVGDKRYLFPGDVRDYDPAGFPDIHGVDVLFYHLWCGDNSLSDQTGVFERRAEDFIRAFAPKKVLIGHLYEAERNEDAMWRYTNAGTLANRLKLEAPEIRAIQTLPGEHYNI